MESGGLTGELISPLNCPHPRPLSQRERGDIADVSRLYMHWSLRVSFAAQDDVVWFTATHAHEVSQL